MVDVTHRNAIRIWRYEPRNLWIAYGLAIFAAGLGALIGLRALYINGVSHDMSFFTTMATTRNRTLDELTIGTSLGGHDIKKDLARTRLMFGVLRNASDKGKDEIAVRAAFGLPSEVSKLSRGESIY